MALVVYDFGLHNLLNLNAQFLACDMLRAKLYERCAQKNMPDRLAGDGRQQFGALEQQQSRHRGFHA